MAYIHQLQTWPDFTWDDAQVLPLLVAVRHRQGRLLGRMDSMEEPSRAEAALENLTSEVTQSSAIEGTWFDPASVRSSVARHMGLSQTDESAPDRMIEGAVEMMMDATAHHAAPLTVNRLWGWQASLFPGGRRGLHRVRIGQWRTPDMDPMQVVSGPIDRDRIRRKNIHFEAPTADRIEAEVARFLTWFEKPGTLDPVLRAGLAHLWFVTIHPFQDGNGRVSRAIAELALARADGSGLRFYNMSAQIEAEKKHYYRTLEETQKGTLDVTGWLTWFLGCLDRAMQRAETTLDRIIHKANLWVSLNRSLTLNARQRLVINALLDDPNATPLSTSRYAKLAGCSLDTALRDIKLLVQAGALVPGEAGGRSTKYHLRTVPAK